MSQLIAVRFARWTSPMVICAVLAVAACGTKSETATGPSPVKCQVSLTAPPAPIAANGGAGTIAVSTTSECSWTASATASWITGLNPASGQGQGQVQFQVAPNPTASSRQGDIMLNGVSARVSQMGGGCNLSLTPANQAFAANAATGSFAVTAPAGCAWTATTTDAWITITAGASGTGNGSVTFSVAANSGGIRGGGIAIGAQTFGITQSAPGAPPPPPPAPACSYSIQPASTSVPSAGGTASVTIQTGTSCAWTAASNASWLSIQGAATGTGNGSVTISAPANTGSARSGTMTIGGQTLTVTQAGACAPTIGSTTQSLSAAGGAGSAISVTAPSSCAWTAVSNDQWLTITSGASGSGSGQVRFSASANAGPARTGTLTIAGLTFTVDQAGSCNASINPTSQSIPAAGGAGAQVSVTTPAGCTWTASTTATWITITAGATGNGNGTVDFTVSANTGGTRTGTISIAGQTHTVTQAAPCAYTLSATSQTLNKNSQKGKDIAVTTAAGCAWTATTTDSWITITSGASGTGNGVVKWSVSQNGTGSTRTGTITVAGQTFTVTQTKN